MDRYMNFVEIVDSSLSRFLYDFLIPEILLSFPLFAGLSERGQCASVGQATPRTSSQEFASQSPVAPRTPTAAHQRPAPKQFLGPRPAQRFAASSSAHPSQSAFPKTTEDIASARRAILETQTQGKWSKNCLRHHFPKNSR